MKTSLSLLIIVAAVVVACGGPVASLLPSGLPSNLPTLPATSEPPASADATPTEKPTKEPTDEPSSEPTQGPTATPEPSPTDGQPTQSPVPTGTAAPEPTATPQLTWTEPLLVADGRYGEPDVLIDDAGVAHVAVAGTGNNNRGIWYLTNAGGEWTSEQVSAPPSAGGAAGGEEYDGEPSIAIDDDGSIYIAFTRWVCGFCAPNPSDGVFGVTNASGDWTDEVQLAGEQTNSPSLVIRGGTWYFAYAEGMLPGLRNYPVWFASGPGGLLGFTRERVDRNGGLPDLDVQGSVPRVLYSGERVNFAIGQTDGSFATQLLPGSNDGFSAVLGIQRGTGEAVAAWSAYNASADSLNSYFAQRVGDAWNPPALALDDVEAIDLGYARSGAVHMLGAGTAEATFDTLFYASSTSPSGQFTGEILSDIGGSDAAMALDDATGQPHVIFATDADGDSGIWYLTGPAI